MLTALYLIAIAVGAGAAQAGEEPLWPLAVIALIAFPFAVGAVSGRRAVSGGPATVLTGLAGGLLVGLAVRLAILAPSWESAATVDCGGATLDDQQLVLWIAALLFALAAVPIIAILAAIGLNVGARAEERLGVPISAYPLGVAAAGLALVGASLVTSC